jgi:hypothetical protein
MLPLPLPDDQGRCVILGRNGVYPPDVKIEDAIKANFMMSDILLEENDRLVICGSVNMMDHEKSSLAFWTQMTPTLGKKMTTLFQVTLAEPPLALNYPKRCYTSTGSSTCIERLPEIFTLDIVCSRNC